MVDRENKPPVLQPVPGAHARRHPMPPRPPSRAARSAPPPPPSRAALSAPPPPSRAARSAPPPPPSRAARSAPPPPPSRAALSVPRPPAVAPEPAPAPESVKLAPDPIIPIDDADLPDDAPTRVLLPSEHIAPAAFAPHGPLPPPPALPPASHAAPPVASQSALRSPPAPPMDAQAALPPAPRTGFRAPMPTEPAAWRRQESLPPPASLQSVPPMALSEPPPPIDLPMRRVPRSLVAVGALAAAAVVAVGFFHVAGAMFTSHGDGSLVATVAGAHGQPLEGLAVFVDGHRRCESSPCRVEALEAGAHFVKVTAPGYAPTATEAIAVQGGHDTALELRLSPSVQAKADATPAKQAATPGDNAKPDDDGVVQPSSLPEAPGKETTSAARPRRAVSYRARRAPAPRSAAADKPTSPATSGKGILLLSCTPAANVAVDGHALGATPKAVRVEAGSHVVLFAGAGGRAVRSVNVKPNARMNVAVKF